MQVKIIGENIEINKYIQNLISDKIATDLNKYLKNFSKDVKTATVKIVKRKDWGYKVDFEMWLPEKKQIFANAIHKDLSSAVVQLREKLERQIKKYKEKLKKA